MVEVGENCKKCKYYGSQTNSCDYILITRRSMMFTDGKRIDPKYCDKFVNEKREYDGHLWKERYIPKKI